METDLREMIIYQIGMPGLWTKFVEMREVVRKEREKVEREQKKPWSWLRSKGRQFIDKWQVRASLLAGCFVLLTVFSALMYAIHVDYQKSKDGSIK